MIDWMHDLGKDWGRWMRRHPNGWPSKSLSGALVEYGSVGAAIKAHGDYIPIRDMPEDILEFHSAWMVAKSRAKYTVYVFYYLVADVESKAEALGVSKSTLYERVTDAQTEIWSLMDLQSRVQKVREVREVLEASA
jgi:hypothetical protein